MTPQEHMAKAVDIMAKVQNPGMPGGVPAEARSVAIQEAQAHALIGLGGLVGSSLEEIKVALNRMQRPIRV